jgi:hypothetical protein
VSAQIRDALKKAVGSVSCATTLTLAQAASKSAKMTNHQTQSQNQLAQAPSKSAGALRLAAGNKTAKPSLSSNLKLSSNLNPYEAPPPRKHTIPDCSTDGETPGSGEIAAALRVWQPFFSEIATLRSG